MKQIFRIKSLRHSCNAPTGGFRKRFARSGVMAFVEACRT